MDNLQQKATMLHPLATLSANRGQLEEAMLLYAEAIKLEERTGNWEGKAASLHQLAGVKAKQGYARVEWGGLD
ncbi:hypothetical protein [Phormidium sp. CCY1219]|uniref:hypothetical protein n=1 Tax=Phormidium sp. CCY1219 TaxID=2886104 RepID=UPI002D1E4B9D|nr:hypothetical protein [Phormidium sp. CCY1219]MEB3831846.1 hypothetical protein [Phormidium sp. CCY1219]